jgi:hypothetical protein
MSTVSVTSGQNSSGIMVGSGDVLTVEFGGTVRAVTIGYGGEISLQGGTASATQVQSGGSFTSRAGAISARW